MQHSFTPSYFNKFEVFIHIMTSLSTKLEYLYYANPYTDLYIGVEENVLGSDFNWAEGIWQYRLGCNSINKDALLGILKREDHEAAMLQLELSFKDKEKVPTASFNAQAKKLKLENPAQALQFLYQKRRAEELVNSAIYGSSPEAITFREQLWKFIFGISKYAYESEVQEQIDALPRLIIGEEGTERLKVAEAVASSKLSEPSFTYIDLAEVSEEDALNTFLSTEDSPGLLEEISENEAVFVDSIELACPQLKRILRKEIETPLCKGYLILGAREDVDISMARIEIPPLRKRINSDPRELFRVCLELSESERIAEKLADKIYYSWPGNITELKGAISHALLFNEYRPSKKIAQTNGATSPYSAFFETGKTLQEVEREYTLFAYENAKSYEGAAKHLNVDWRTVKAKLEAF